MERRIAITTDPVDQMRYRLALAHFYEDQSRTADAQRVLTRCTRRIRTFWAWFVRLLISTGAPVSRSARWKP